jgi:NAD(P)-dependent dehydrogenase (short-subunit alcohol dehydrogenase family)
MKTVIVTGASTGIGRATAIEFGKEGALVILIARRVNELKKTKKLVEEAGGNGIVFQADLSNIDSINKLSKKIKKEIKRIDVLINIAGIWHGKNEVYAGKNFEKFSKKTIIDTYSVGLLAPTLLSHAFIPIMRKKSSIINLSGTFEDGAKGWLPYYVSKRAIEDLTVGLSEELESEGIKVYCVSPSDTATEEYHRFFPKYAKGAQSPEEVARLIVKVSKKNITGKTFIIKNSKVTEGFHK